MLCILVKELFGYVLSFSFHHFMVSIISQKCFAEGFLSCTAWFFTCHYQEWNIHQWGNFWKLYSVISCNGLAASLHPSKTSVKLSTACDALPFRQTQQRMSDFHHLECLRCIGWPTLYIYKGGHDEHTYTRQQKECEGTCDALLQPLRKRFPKGTAHLSKDFCFCTWIALLKKLLFSLRILLGHCCFMVSRCA